MTRDDVIPVAYASLNWSAPSPALRQSLRALDDLFRQEREEGVTPVIYLYFEIGTPAEIPARTIRRRRFDPVEPSIEVGVSFDATLSDADTKVEFHRIVREAVSRGAEWLAEKGLAVDVTLTLTRIDGLLGVGKSTMATTTARRLVETHEERPRPDQIIVTFPLPNNWGAEDEVSVLEELEQKIEAELEETESLDGNDAGTSEWRIFIDSIEPHQTIARITPLLEGTGMPWVATIRQNR